MTLFSVFSAAERAPELPLLCTRGTTLSFADVAERTERAAAALSERGLLGTDPVGLIPRVTPESLAVLLALFAHGVPALLLHPKLPRSEAEALARRANARAVLAPDEDALTSTRRSAPRPPTSVDEDAPLVIVPTSGSTGRRKLVRLSARALRASAESSNANLPLVAGDRWLLSLPLSHVGGLSIVTRSLLSQTALVLFEQSSRGLLASLPELASCITSEGVTLASFVPTVLDALLDLKPQFTAPVSLRAVLLGGAATPHKLYCSARERGFNVLTTYGLTEAASQVTTTPLGSEPVFDGTLVSAGRPLPGVQVRVLADGRIRVRSGSLGAYLDAPTPLDEHGFLLTEDRGRIGPEGDLFVLGRTSDLIVTGGENVDPGVVEAALESAPSVRAAVVFGIPDPRFGEIVVCAIVAAPEFSWPELEAAAFPRLASYERPRRAAIVTELPLLSNGKLDRAAARGLVTAALRPWGESVSRER